MTTPDPLSPVVISETLKRIRRLGAYEAIVRDLPFGIVAVDPEGKVLVSSRVMNLWIGHNEFFLDGKALFDFVVEADRDRTLQEFRQQRDQGGMDLSRHFINRYLHASGVWVRLSWPPFRGVVRVNAEPIVVGFCVRVREEDPGTPV